MALMRSAHGAVPSRTRRIALGVRVEPGDGIFRAGHALIIVGVEAAGIVRIILALFDITHQVTTGVHGLERTEAPVDSQRRVFELILVIRRIEERDRQIRQPLSIGPGGHLIEYALCVHVLVRLVSSAFQSSLIFHKPDRRAP